MYVEFESENVPHYFYMSHFIRLQNHTFQFHTHRQFIALQLNFHKYTKMGFLMIEEKVQIRYRSMEILFH